MSDKKNLKPLVRRAMKGDSAAFEKLIENFSVDIVFNVSTQLDSKNDVQDVAQEVVLALYNNIGKLQSPNAFYAYLRRIITNVCITHNQKHSKLHQAADIDDYINEFEAERNEQPQLQFEQAALTDQVKRAIAQLPTKQREALYLYYYNDLSYKEIARVQGVSTNTVGANINKAKAALKGMIEMQDAGDINTNQGAKPGNTAKSDSLPDNAQKLGSGGAITTPVLVDAVSKSVGELAPKTTLDSLPVYAHQLIIEGGGIALSAAIGIFAFTTKQLAVAAIVITLAVGGLVTAGNLFVNAEAPATETVIQYTSFVPKASIEFLSNTHPQNINPSSAQATTDAGVAGAWSVVDQSGKIVLNGQGSTTGEVLASLPKGKYAISWKITSSTTEQSDPAVMRREFTIK